MPVFLFIFLLLLIAYGILIDYYRRAWNAIPGYERDENLPNTFVSVIVPVRNEEKNISQLLASISRQSYPKDLFELIVVDDHSEDNTVQLVQQFKSELNIVLVKLSDFIVVGEEIRSHKKKAIETAIGKARGNLLVTTDADCRFPSNWLLTIAQFYERNGACFIAAPVKINYRPSLLSIFQTTDFLTLQGITGASVYKRVHSMCNGANLAYEKKIFIEVNGFEGIDSLASGDDMLLMHKIFVKYPNRVFYLKSKDAIVSTEAMNTWKDFFQQRIRWASKAAYYDDKRIFYVLLLVYFVNLGFLVLAISAFFKASFAFFLMLLFVAKLLIEFPFVNAVSIFFGQQSLMKYFMLLQPLHIAYTLVAGWLGRFGSFEWKGRTIRNNK